MSDDGRTDWLATFDVYEDAGGEWRWRLVHRNGNIIADSAEGYSSQAAAIDGSDTVRAVAPTADIDVEEADGEPIPDGGERMTDHEPFCDDCGTEVVYSEGLTARATLLCADCADPTISSHKYMTYETTDGAVFVAPAAARGVADHGDGEPIPDGGPITDVDLVPVDEDVVEAGYPVGALNQAILVSQERFRGGLSEWDEGDNWTGANPYDLSVAVHRNARGAALAFDDGDHAEARKEIGDALNYLLFLRNLISAREGGDSS